MNQEKIGDFISKCRKEKNMTQEQLAEKLGVSNKSISRWENGNTMPDLSMYKDLSNILGISVIELLNGEKLSEKEKNYINDENIIRVFYTKKSIENMQILTEILIFAGIIISITITSIVAKTNIHKAITLISGCFVWAYGIFLRVKLRKILNQFEFKDINSNSSKQLVKK